MGRTGEPGHPCDLPAVPQLRHAGAVGACAVSADLPAGVGSGPGGEAGSQRAGGRAARRADRGGAPALPLAAPLRRRVQRPGRLAGRSQRRHGGGGKHVPVPGRSLLRLGPDLDRADASPRRAPGSRHLGLRAVFRPPRRRPRALHPGSVTHRDRRHRCAGHGTADGRRVGASAPVRRERGLHRRAPGARTGHATDPRGLPDARGQRLRRTRGAGGHHVERTHQSRTRRPAD